jgi:hypothetical protein
MISFKLDKVSYETYNTIIDLIGGFNRVSVNGVTLGSMDHVEIKDNKLKNYCNKFTVKHFYPKEKGIVIKNNTMVGKYNLINLVDLKKGSYSFKIRKSNEKINNALTFNKKEMANTVFSALKNHGAAGHVKVIKDITTRKNIIIGGYDIKKNKVLYLQNISGKDGKPVNIDITYEDNHIQLVCENVNANINLHNKSEPRIVPCTKLNKEVEEDNKERIIRINEGFSSTNNGCTSGKEMIIIGVIIFLVYKMLTKRTIIKLFE